MNNNNIFSSYLALNKGLLSIYFSSVASGLEVSEKCKVSQNLTIASFLVGLMAIAGN